MLHIPSGGHHMLPYQVRQRFERHVCLAFNRIEPLGAPTRSLAPISTPAPALVWLLLPTTLQREHLTVGGSKKTVWQLDLMTGLTVLTTVEVPCGRYDEGSLWVSVRAVCLCRRRSMCLMTV